MITDFESNQKMYKTFLGFFLLNLAKYLSVQVNILITSKMTKKCYRFFFTESGKINHCVSKVLFYVIIWIFFFAELQF